MYMTFKDAFDEVMKNTSLSLRSVSKLSGVSYDQLRNLKQGKARTTNVDDAIRVAKCFGVSLDDFMEGKIFKNNPSNIPVLGTVGVGSIVNLVDSGKDAKSLYNINMPYQLKQDQYSAVEILGNSMEPLYFSSGIIIYKKEDSRISDDFENRVCVCVDFHGGAWLKQVKTGSQAGFYSLISLNTTSTNIHNIKLKWAAPVVIYLPPQFVEKTTCN